MPPNLIQLTQKMTALENELKSIKALLSSHQHTISDGTSPLRKNIALDVDQFFSIGPAQMLTKIDTNGTAEDSYDFVLSVGPDVTTSPVYKSQNMQMDFLHKPNGTQSFLRVYRSPLVSSYPGRTISVTSGGSTVTVDGYNFQTNELAGTLINIFNSSGSIVETQTIASNTSNVITITGTWISSTSGATFLILVPIYLGSAETVLQRTYIQEGTTGGIRFGVGKTWVSGTAQNGLLYMDATGDLYWRNKSGTSTKLN